MEELPELTQSQMVFYAAFNTLNNQRRSGFGGPQRIHLVDIEVISRCLFLPLSEIIKITIELDNIWIEWYIKNAEQS